MQMPSAETVSKLLSSLLGDDYVVKSSDAKANVDDLMKGFAAICYDDAGNPVGAIVADLVATVSLGGKLMMLPQGGLEDQVDEGKADEMVVEAVSEVFNNLTSTMNRTPGNPHIRSDPATAVAALVGQDSGSWMKTASVRGDYSGEFCCGMGKVAIIWR